MGTRTCRVQRRPSPTSTLPTHVAFRKFIELADLNSIKIFITTASSSSEGENLKLLWGHAFKEGLSAGHQLYGKMEERLKEVREEGYQAGYIEGQHDERGDWALDEHSLHCGYQTNIPYDDYGTPATTFDISTQTVSTATVSSQTQTTSPLTTSFTTVSIQTSHEDIEKTDHNPTST